MLWRIWVMAGAFLVVYTAVLPAKRGKVAVAPVKFKNNTGKKGLNFLSLSLANAVTSAMSKEKKIDVVERVQMGKLLKELELQQSGLFNEDAVKKQGKKLAADYLVLGSYSGKSSKIRVFIKAADVRTGKVAASRVVVAAIDDLIPRVEQQARQIARMLTGSGVGTLSVTSDPRKAEVYLNEDLIGKTPLIGYKVNPGKHELKLLKAGHKDYETTVRIRKNQVTNVQGFLPKTAFRNRFELAVGTQWFIPPEVKSGFLSQRFSKSDFIFMASLGHTFDRAAVAFEFGFNTRLANAHEYAVPYREVSEERDYRMLIFNGVFKYSIVDFGQSVAMYLGGFGGYYSLKEKNIDEERFGASSEKHDLFAGGPILGLAFLPYGPISILIEGRYLIAAQKFKRENIDSVNFFGGATTREEEIRLNGPSFGISLRFNF